MKIDMAESMTSKILHSIVCRAGIWFSLLLCFLWVSIASAQQSAIELVTAGDVNVILMRHALAPGTGDPGNFTLGQCETQRNLNDVGRQQALDTGQFLRDSGVSPDTVYTSQWCRCVETAELLRMGGEVVELPVINSFFQEMSKSSSQTKALQQWLADQSGDGLIMLITHQVNITAYTGVYPRSGELVVGKYDKNGEFTLLGRIDPR